MEMINLVPVQEKDIPQLSALAELVWWQHYPSIISKEQISYMLDKMYNPESLVQQMQSKNHQFYFISSVSDTIGFLSVNEEEKGNWFLNKFYIDQTKSAKGVGSVAFKQLLQLLNPQTIRLTVNRQNYKSVNFYFKNNFVIEKVADFDIGNGFVMDDFVMLWKK
jgi:diamine N-acetyltransferase